MSGRLFSSFSTVALILAVAMVTLFLPGASASARDWFVRPDSAGYGTGTGRDYLNAWSGLSHIVWGRGGVEPGDTLYICGSHIYRMLRNHDIATQAVIPVAGGAGENARITIRGDYQNDNGVIWGAYARDYSGKGYSTPLIWREDPAQPRVWSTVLDANHYGDWFFEKTATGGRPLDKAANLTELQERTGSFFIGGEPRRGSRLYVHLSEPGDPGKTVLLNRYGYRFSLGSNGYVTFKNLSFMAPAPFWTGRDRPHHVSFRGCRFFYGESRMISLFDGMDHFEIEGCEIAWAGNGIYTISNSATAAPSHYRFVGNYIHDIGVRPIQQNRDAHAIGIQGGHDGVITDNVIKNSGSAILLNAFTKQVLKDTLVARNRVDACHRLGGSAGYGISTQCSNNSLSDKTGNKFFNNIVTYCPVGFRFQFETEQEVYNNLAAYCEVGIAANRTFQEHGPVIKARNNAIVGSSTAHVRFATAGKSARADFDHNLYFPDGPTLFRYGRNSTDFRGWRDAAGAETDGHSIVADPQLAADSRGRPHPVEGSPLLGDDGIGVGLTSDIDGVGYFGPPPIGPFAKGLPRP